MNKKDIEKAIINKEEKIPLLKYSKYEIYLEYNKNFDYYSIQIETDWTKEVVFVNLNSIDHTYHMASSYIYPQGLYNKFLIPKFISILEKFDII